MDQNILELILEGSMKPMNLPLETLRKITDGFSSDRIIGEGGFGTVYKGDVGNENVAIKRIKSGMTINDKLFRREVDNLMEVNHPNVVRFLGLCSNTVETPVKDPESRGYIYAEIRERLLCFEYVSNGSLDTRITDELRGLEWDTRYGIIKGICAGLHYLHMEKHILHMDLKPANILLDNQMVPKITDFGLSRPMENSQTMTTNHFASPGYSAPENLFGGGKMSIQSDMHSLGVIIIELVTGHRGTPECNNTLRRWRHRWNKSGKEIPLEYHQQVTKCIEIGSLCQKENPYARPFISDVMGKLFEMENLNDHSWNADESTVGQINLPTWEDDMLGVEPLELQFAYNKQEDILSCLVELSNDTDGFIFFEIQKIRPLPYSIKPNKDILKPRSKCCVIITLPAAHTAALQSSTSNKRYTKEFVVRSTKVNEDLSTKNINQDLFDKHTEGQHIDEIHLGALSEEPRSQETIDFSRNEAMEQHTSSGRNPLPTPIEAGLVQLAIKNNTKASSEKCNKKVMLEISGCATTCDRLGLDLVVVLHASRNMDSEKMDHVKMAMRFVLRKLSPMDRLSIITIFSDSAVKLCPLQQITESSRRKLDDLIDGLKAIGDFYTHIKGGLLTGLKVLTYRNDSSDRIAGIMLMSNDQQAGGGGGATQINLGNVPVYTFGFGMNSDHTVLSMIAANSMGGTFSHIRDQDIGSGGLTMAFSQCLAGLLTVSVQNLELTVAPVGHESEILNVTAGSYPKTQAGGSVTVRFGNIYSREVRKVVVNLRLPAIGSEHSAEILKDVLIWKQICWEAEVCRDS
ncbi:uncharacterized protein LOC119366811 [Triticum dicoccoides]|uniref:uncharacterized protein LOC119366811 n=1 Tax=Triticum dicoccoides TaxID=85692 RepID=UPI00188DEC8D|nr:uncharacterized protein LOC119366811 [Triticum dicoccoides]XP_037488421.1 uncharacterized protein LOC119366811 [Triticum dicoccoides]